ncbi:MAG: orotate phosphoribosyltransferase [Clostridia bacterium]|nr:orotate phosphoribosyltransferase [Clostridia bacterium]
MQNKEQFIEFMLSQGVLRFGEFVTKSGRLSPYFVNTGLYSTGEAANKLGEFYAAAILENIGEDFDALFGPAYKGISLAALTAEALWRVHGKNRTFFYNRKEAKDHGEGGSFVGKLPPKGSRIVIVEDVVTAGTAVRETLPLLQEQGYEVKHMIVSVNRMEKGQTEKSAKEELKENFDITLSSIVTARDLYDYLIQKGESEQAAKMKAYMDTYCVG